MKGSETNSAVLDAMRLGFEPKRVGRFSTSLVLQPETLTISAESDNPDQEYPLLICLHPHTLTEFQFAQKVRSLTQANIHFAFPQGLYPHEVDLGGARTLCYAWCHYTGDNPLFRRNLNRAIDYLDEIIETLLDKLPTDRRSIYILGMDSSSLMAATYGLARNEIFAGIITAGGALHPEILNNYLPEKRRLPFLCIYNQRNKIVRSGDIARQVKDLEAMGFPVNLRVSGDSYDGWVDDKEVILSWLVQHGNIEVVEEEY